MSGGNYITKGIPERLEVAHLVPNPMVATQLLSRWAVLYSSKAKILVRLIERINEAGIA